MSHSLQMVKPGVMDFRILHRFGPINGGFYQAFGLDGPATIRLGLDYGFSNNLTIGVGHATYKKEIDAFLKYRILQQTTQLQPIPFSLVWIGGVTVIRDTNMKKDFNSSLGYYLQMLLGRKFSDGFSLQFSPIWVHRDSSYPTNPKNTFALGAGLKIKLTKRTSLTADYYYIINPDRAFAKAYAPFSVGVDLETGGHVFQLHFTNATGMNEREFITETRNQWSRGEIIFGFNIVRSFQLKKRHF
ncbi:MAG: DUF5777 family beta-barrel protein [Flavisolibacter sp.]